MTIPWPPFVSTVGLVLDIAGVVLLFIYGLPAKVDPAGIQYIAVKNPDPEQIALGKKYTFRSRAGLSLLIAGFVLQAVGTWMSWYWRP